MFRRQYHLVPAIVALLLISFGCTDSVFEIPQSTQIVQVIDDDSTDQTPPSIFLIDESGKEWDITHAVYEYGMDPARFDFGLGPFAIPPLQNPRFACPGEPGYPGESANEIVIATTIDGESRGYALTDMRAFEVTNDRFERTFVATAY